MKRYFLTLILFLTVAMSAMAAQEPDVREQAKRIADAISVPLYGYDIRSVTSVIETMVKDNHAIRAVEIIDANSESVIFQAYKSNDNSFHSGEPITSEQKQELQQLIHPVAYEQEEIGNLRLYYMPGEESTIKLSTEERAWIRLNPVLRVGNELDWPPFDFAENGEPKGYSIDLINLIGKKTGLKFEFINGYTWSELLEKFKVGEIDIMPAIYVDEQRKTYIAYTDSYFSQPSVIVVNKDSSDIEKLLDLSGKRLAVIEGYSITKAIAKNYPDIQRVPMQGVLAAIGAVSLGQVDAFIDSIGVISATIEKNFIPDIKVISDTSLKEVENPAIHIGVSRQRPILRDILNKSLGAVTREEKNALRQKWIPLKFDLEKVAPIPDSSYRWIMVTGVVIFLVIVVLVIIHLWRAQGEKKAILVLLILMLFGLACAEFVTIKYYVSKNETIARAKVLRLESLQIVDLIRQTSDDLTRMARSFAVTGDQRFENYFNRILAIRKGEAPRPLDYGKIYWDYVVASGREPRSSGKSQSIEDLMRLSGFDDEEFNLLRTAKNKSNTLAELEREAMNAAKGLFEDGIGSYKIGTPNLLFAQNILFGESYHQAKADIMATIDSVGLHVDRRTLQTIEQLDFEARELIWIATLLGLGCLLIVGLLLLLSAMWMSSSKEQAIEGRSIEKNIAEGPALKRFILSALIKSWPLILTSIIVAALITSLSWRNMVHLVAQERGDLRESLNSVLQMTAKATQSWIQEREQEVRIWAQLPKLNRIFGELSSSDKAQVTNSDKKLFFDHQSNLSAFLDPLIVEQGYLGYLVVDSKGEVLGSDRNALIGMRLDTFEDRFFLERAMAGPMFSAIRLPSKSTKGVYSFKQKAVMMSGALIRPIQGGEPGVLILLIDPEEEFTDILQQGRIGNSGESYAFNRSGLLISESRFDNNLRDMGLISSGERGILNIAIRDPGGNMLEGFTPTAKKDDLPLTLMAASAIEGNNGLNLDGYNDYRGVPVIGAWIWDEAVGYGLATEMDVAEAYTSINNLRRQALVTILISVGLLLILTGIFVYGRIRTLMANDQLRVSEAQHKTIFQNSPLGMILFNTAGTIVECNEPFADLMESPTESLIGFNTLENAPVQAIRDALEEALNGKQTEFEGEYTSATGGKTSYLRIIFNPVNPEQIPNEVIATLEDITDRKQAEQELQKLSSAVEQSQVSVVITDLQGTIEYVNPKFTEVSGYSAKEVLGQNPRLLNAGIQSAEFYKEMWNTILAGDDWHGEFANRKKNGDIFWENATISPIRNSENRVTHYVAVKEDVSKRKLTEEALKDSEETLSTITSSVLSAIIMLDADNDNISFWNEAAENIFGWSAQEAIGRNLHDLIIPEQYRQQHIEGLKRFCQTGEGPLIGQSTEISALNREDKEFPVELNLSSVKLKDRWHAIGLITDITDRKQAEKELNKAKEIAEEATKAKSDFLANMSHEIRTPMNAVIGLSDLCLRTDLTPKQNDYLVKIHSSANSLLGIINDILDFSKIEAGKLDMESIPFELDKVLNNLATIISVKTEEKGLELLFSRHPDVPLGLMGDPLRLGQILTNLANNAVKFTDKGEIIVSITPNKISDEKCILEFRVTDSGIGMTHEQQSRLFTSFSQADTSTTRKYGGTGLGLAISKQLVELMGGTIWVESEPEKGSTFAFTAAFAIEQIQQKTPLVPSPDLRGMRVLIVDDNEAARVILTSYLEQFSFVVDHARSGEEALSVMQASKEPFGLVMLDYMMPGLNGIETARKIHENFSESEIKMILVSSLNQAEYENDPGFELLDNYLSKPTNPSLLFDVIMEVFGRLDPSEKKARQATDDENVIRLQAIRGARILLVEDNMINQQVATEFLEQAGFFVDVANNGLEALGMIEQATYDCLLMDVQMPVMDGYTATARIREMEKYADLPVLAMTANALAEDKERALAAGMNDHLTKPINPDELFTALIHWIKTEGREFDAPPPLDKVSDIAEEVNLPDSLPGIDVETGVQQIGGNARLYMKLLRDFFMDHQADASAIHNAIGQQDFAAAQRLAHTLKGVGATIGAGDLQRTAEHLESAFKDESMDAIHQAMPSFEQSMGMVISGLEQHLKKELADETRPTIANPADLLPMLDKLHNLLEEMDPDAEELANRIRQQLGNVKITGGLPARLTKQVSGFEFDEALATLQALKEKIEEAIDARG